MKKLSLQFRNMAKYFLTMLIPITGGNKPPGVPGG